MDDGAWLDELKRRAYSSDDASAVDARERLALLERERVQEQDAPAPVIPNLPASRLAPRWIVAGIGLLAVAATAGAVVATSVPQSSLAIFDRAQNAQDLRIPTGIGASRGTERWLGDYGGYGVFAFYSPSGEVCVVAVEPDTVSGNCVPRAEFLTSGITLDTGLFTSTGTEYFSVTWGPNGPAQFADGPPASDETGAR